MTVDVVDAWYTQEQNVKDYNKIEEQIKELENGTTTTEIRNFTQVVWKGTQKIGAGRSKSNSGKTYIVVMYEPSGNWEGGFQDNVPPRNSK